MPIDLLRDLTENLESTVKACSHHPVDLKPPATLEEEQKLWAAFQLCKPEARMRHMRKMALCDLYFLGRYVLGWNYADHPFQFDRAREVEASPDGHLDLWSRGHMKTHWITIAKTIQDILKNPETTVVIFSHTRPIAKGFLRVIKQIFTTNELLKSLFPDVLWKDPENEAPKWSEDDGICVKRKVVRLEQTVEAWGLVDGQPTSKHFDIQVYDDIVTLENVTSNEQINKTTNAWEISLNLALPNTRQRYIGTFYHELDTYHTLIERGTVKVRRYPIMWEDGPEKGKPCFFTVEQVQQRKRDMGPRNFALQCLLDPKADTTKDRWRVEWIERYGKPITSGMNVYILCDPANAQSKRSDYTVILVIGLGYDRKYYILDGVRDRMTLKQRTEAVIRLHRKYTGMGAGMMPKIVGYEQYGKDADIDHIREKMDEMNYRFSITPLAGRLSKEDRIMKLRPIFEEHRFYFPSNLYFTDYEGKQVEFVSQFITEEYTFMPDPKHDDILDCMARILDPKVAATFPISPNGSARNDYAAPRLSPATWAGAI